MISDIIWLAAISLVFLFCFVILFGAPYLPTLKLRTEEALDLLDLKPGQTLLELGCGDGRVLRAAARRGIHGVGYELNPVLVMCAKVVTWKYRNIVDVRWANYWRVSLPKTDGIYVFLLDKYMSKLNKKIIQDQSGAVTLVSYAFTIPHRRPTREAHGLFVYKYNQSVRPNQKTIEK